MPDKVGREIRTQAPDVSRMHPMILTGHTRDSSALRVVFLLRGLALRRVPGIHRRGVHVGRERIYAAGEGVREGDDRGKRRLSNGLWCSPEKPAREAASCRRSQCRSQEGSRYAEARNTETEGDGGLDRGRRIKSAVLSSGRWISSRLGRWGDRGGERDAAERTLGYETVRRPPACASCWLSRRKVHDRTE